MKTFRYAFWAIVGLCLVLIGLSNRGMVELRAMPQALADALRISPDVTLPLFVVILLSVGAGLLIGFVWEWVREHQIRAESRARAREVEALRRENAELKREKAVTQGDDVLALLDGR